MKNDVQTMQLILVQAIQTQYLILIIQIIRVVHVQYMSDRLAQYSQI